MLRKIIYSIALAVLWATAGTFLGASFAYNFDRPVSPLAFAGLLIGAGLGFIYGLVSRREKVVEAGLSDKKRQTLVRCAWCKGAGIVGKKQTPCDVCLGQGRLLTDTPVKPCLQCSGKGQRWLGRRCKVCDGSGYETHAVFDYTPRRKQRSSGKPAAKQRSSWWKNRFDMLS